MAKNIHETLLVTMADTLPFKILVKQVQRGIDEYLENPSEEREGYLVFVMQIAMLKHIMQRQGKDANDILQDIEKHGDIMDLFKENNN
jgi:hypothetical protein